MISLLLLMLYTSDDGRSLPGEPTVRLFHVDAQREPAGTELTFDVEISEHIRGGKLLSRRLERSLRKAPRPRGSGDGTWEPDFRTVRFEVDVPVAFRRATKAVGVRLSLWGKGNAWRTSLGLRKGPTTGRAPWLERCYTWPCWLVVDVFDEQGNIVWTWQTQE